MRVNVSKGILKNCPTHFVRVTIFNPKVYLKSGLRNLRLDAGNISLRKY